MRPEGKRDREDANDSIPRLRCAFVRAIGVPVDVVAKLCADLEAVGMIARETTH